VGATCLRGRQANQGENDHRAPWKTASSGQSITSTEKRKVQGGVKRVQPAQGNPHKKKKKQANTEEALTLIKKTGSPVREKKGPCPLARNKVGTKQLKLRKVKEGVKRKGKGVKNFKKIGGVGTNIRLKERKKKKLEKKKKRNHQ